MKKNNNIFSSNSLSKICQGRIFDSFLILSLNGKIRIRENPHSRIFYAVIISNELDFMSIAEVCLVSSQTSTMELFYEND